MLTRNVIYKVKIKYLLVILVLFVVLKLFGVFTHFFEKDYHTTFDYPYNGEVHTFSQQLRYNQKPDIPPINGYNYSFIHNPRKKCTTDDDVVPIRLIFLVKSAPEHIDNRIAIRSTWGYESRFSDVEIRTVFLLGVRDKTLQEKIDTESKKFEDIIQANFSDNYFNNTIKTMIGFKWAVNYCAESKFYMFVDDDYYVSTKNVLRFVRNPTNYPEYLKKPIYSLKKRRIRREALDFELPDDARLYTGFVFFSAPHRHITSKWHVSLEEYPFHMWPPYVTAGAYILSREALLDMYFTSFYTKHFRFDDIYVGILAKKANIEPFHSGEFYFYKQVYQPNNYVFTVASHGYSDPEELLQVWTEQKSSGNA